MEYVQSIISDFGVQVLTLVTLLEEAMDTRPVVEHLKKAEQILRRKIEDLKKPMAQAEEDLRSVLGTIAFYERNQRALDATGSLEKTVGVFSAGNLRGMSHTQAVVAIAKNNGGVVKAQDAKRLMIQAGVMRDTKNSTHMVHNAIINSDRFDRIGRGEFRLKTIGNGNGHILPASAKLEAVAHAGSATIFPPKSPLQ
jgi:hypothetical protein